MRRLGAIAVALLWLVCGCGSNKTAVVEKPRKQPPKPVASVVAEVDNEPEEPLAEDLSPERLEELYAKGSSGMENSVDQEIKKWEMQARFDMPIHVNKQVRNYIVYFSTQRKAIFSRYLARSTRYLPMIKKVFAEYGLPEDLAYLAMIESGFNNKAYSVAAACGMWQFIRGTGSRYGLAMDNYVDERRDPEKATRAAAEYLLDLYKRFGSWYLAAASYNCGEGRVQREIDSSSHKNFWELSDNMCLPTETKNYVPQMIAAIIISKSPQKYGFKGIGYQPPLKYDLVKVTEPTSVGVAGIATGTSPEEIALLNPELLRGTTPPNQSAYLLKVPAGKKEAFANNIAMARGQMPTERTYARRSADDDDDDDDTASTRSTRSTRTASSRPKADKHYARETAPVTAAAVPANLCYRVRPGDTLTKIAQRYQTSESSLLAQNNLKSGRDIKNNQVLLIAAHRPKNPGKSTPAAVKREEPADDPEPVAASILPGFSSSKAKAKSSASSKASRKSDSQAVSKQKSRTTGTEKKSGAVKGKKGKTDAKSSKAKSAASQGRSGKVSRYQKTGATKGSKLARSPDRSPARKVAKSSRRTTSKAIAHTKSRSLHYSANLNHTELARPN